MDLKRKVPIEEKISIEQRVKLGSVAVKEIVSKLWLYIVIGVGVGAVVHGYVPESFMLNIIF